MEKQADRPASIARDELLVQLDGGSYRFRLSDRSLALDGLPIECATEPAGEDVFVIVADGERRLVWVAERYEDRLVLSIEGFRYEVAVSDARSVLRKLASGRSTVQDASKEIKAPMPGLVTRILVTEGETVRKGQGLVILEAMKMENEIRADAGGIVERIRVHPRMAVEKGEVLVTIHQESRTSA